jgi:AraC-like DNA-binding protein
MGDITKEFNIKGMICSNCIKILAIEFKEIDAEIIDIKLGKIVLRYNPEKVSNSTIEKIINNNRFEVIANSEDLLAEQVKKLIIEYVWTTDLQENLSDYITNRMNRNYDHLSKVFSKIFNKTVRQYTILLKVERTKELIEDDQINFSDIAYSLGYQNSSALSRQFKNVTGINLSEYKNHENSKRIPIDKI